MSTTYYSPSTGSVLLKSESSYGSASGSNLTPAADVFDSGTQSAPFDMAAVAEIALSTADRSEMRSARSQKKPDVLGVRESGTKVGMRRGQVTLTYRVQGVGTSTSDDHPLHILLTSMMADGGEPSDQTDAVQTYHDPAPGSTAANAFYFYPTDDSRYSAGDVVTVDVDGRPYALYVTEVDSTGGSEYVAVQGAPRHLTNGDTIRFCRNFKNQAAGASFAMRLDKPGYRAECYGCRVVGVSATMEVMQPSAVLRLQFTIDVGFLRYDHANASVTRPTYTDGDEMQLHGSTISLGAALPAEGTAGPYKSSLVSDIFVSVVGLNLTAEVQQVPDHKTVVAGEQAIDDIIVENTIRLSRPQTGFDDDMEQDGVERFVSICIGSTGAGQALAFVIPCAFSTADPGARAENGENLTQQLTLGAESPRGTLTASDADSSFIIATVH